MSHGWILLHRQIQDCWIWQDKPFDKARAWIDLLLLANHKDVRISIDGKPVLITRGQFFTSIEKLSDRWGWDRKTVRRFLDVLESDHMLSRESTRRGTTITIVNYDDFQYIGTTERTSEGTSEGTPKGTSEGTQTNKEKNVKNGKNNKGIYFPDDEELNQTFLDYIKMRKEIKKPMSVKAISLALNKIETLSGGDREKAIQILNQSIFHSWQGLFELKGEQTTKKPQYKQFAHRDDGLTDLERELISN